MIHFGRDICGNWEQATRREWLVTNGIGGFASGTMAGALTRRYHGLLVAALQPPLGRTVCLAKLDETVRLDGSVYELSTNQWASGKVDPEGYRFLERFHRDGTTPVWTYQLDGALLEKRIWMHPGANTTYVQYHYARPSTKITGLPLAITLQALVTYRDYHSFTQFNQSPDLQVAPAQGGVKISCGNQLAPYYLFSDRGEYHLRNEWILDFFLAQEAYRGEPPLEDLLYAAELEAVLQPGDRLTIAASTEPGLEFDGKTAYAARTAHEQELLHLAGLDNVSLASTVLFTGSSVNAQSSQYNAVQADLALAADQFIVRRSTTHDRQGSTVIAGYPWFTDWGRDTMISLPGLTLAVGRPELACRILRTFAACADRGMLPNRFPDAGETPEYNTVDATLWFFEALRAYDAAAGDEELLAELFPLLEDIFAWHQRGTRYNIRVDPEDGLLYAGEAGVQLTWMDVKIDDWVVTPRTGKAVEINALWYNALCILAEFAQRLGRPSQLYQSAAEKARQGFARFWNPSIHACYDVIDGPDGADPALRPNQLLAVSLPHSPLPFEQQKAVVDICDRQLVTSYGLRSLARDDPAYIGRYGGDRVERDRAYHQGTVWGWWLGPFVSAHLRVYHNPQQALTYLLPLFDHLSDHGIGSLSEIFDGDPPFTPRGCIAQAWTVAEVNRALREIEQAAALSEG